MSSVSVVRFHFEAVGEVWLCADGRAAEYPRGNPGHFQQEARYYLGDRELPNGDERVAE